ENLGFFEGRRLVNSHTTKIMKSQFLILGVLLIFVSSCNNKYKKDFYIFKSTLNNNNSIIFFVDEKEIDQVPYIDTIQSTNFTSQAKLIRLGKGKHEITAKDKAGNYLSSVIIEITGKELNIGALSKSNHTISAGVVNFNDSKYRFKNRTTNEFFIFSFE